MTADAIELALLAVRATADGDDATAAMRLSAAQRESRASARRHRQVVEIAAMVVAGKAGRAGDLALVHTAEFPGDAELLARLTHHDSAPSARRQGGGGSWAHRRTDRHGGATS